MGVLELSPGGCAGFSRCVPRSEWCKSLPVLSSSFTRKDLAVVQWVECYTSIPIFRISIISYLHRLFVAVRLSNFPHCWGCIDCCCLGWHLPEVWLVIISCLFKFPPLWNAYCGLALSVFSTDLWVVGLYSQDASLLLVGKCCSIFSYSVTCFFTFLWYPQKEIILMLNLSVFYFGLCV